MTKHLTASFMLLAAAVLSGCDGGAGNSAVANSNGPGANSNRSMANSPATSAGNASNSMANTVSNTAATGAPSPDDFLKKAAQGGMAEVELGKLAGQKGQNAEVKAYGQMMVGDHTKANAELKALADKKSVTLPTDMGPHAATHEKLKGMSGPEFDRAYVTAMVADHEATVADFQKQADGAADAEVKAFAAKTLPTLQAHLEKIKAIQAKLK